MGMQLAAFVPCQWASVAAIAASKLGAPTDGCGRIFPHLRRTIWRNSSVMVMEFAGVAPVMAKMTAIETTPSE